VFSSNRSKIYLENQNRKIAIWLLTVVGLLFGMVILGGVTRLTGSGLSIVEWQPFTGIIPPLSEKEWVIEFEKYRLYPEFLSVNFAISISDFKEIYWYEWAHRILGRVIGLVFFIPMVWFIIRRQINFSLAINLLIILCLGGLQGFLGWYMVKSGLVDEPQVSPYRLAAHLGLALVILIYLLWVALGLINVRSSGARREGSYGYLRIILPIYIFIVFFTILTGAFVAGNEAGHLYNTFPLMDEHIVPPDIFVIDSVWRNFFENAVLVQLDHRLAAALTVLLGIAISVIGQGRGIPLSARRVLLILGLLVLTQFLMGIFTLLLSVPIPLAALHQGFAVLIICSSIWGCHELYRRK
tara:strand:- start:6778 stop:7839 length:1062 start_codon:yes stop_codon:yes gene_type:complete